MLNGSEFKILLAMQTALIGKGQMSSHHIANDQAPPKSNGGRKMFKQNRRAQLKGRK